MWHTVISHSWSCSCGLHCANTFVGKCDLMYVQRCSWSVFIYCTYSGGAFLPLAAFIDCCAELIIEAKLRIAATFDTYSSSIHASCIYSWTSLYLIENIDIHFFCQLHFCAVCIPNPILIEQLHVCVYVKRITGHCNYFLSLCCLSNLVTRRRCKRWAAVQM